MPPQRLRSVLVHGESIGVGDPANRVWRVAGTVMCRPLLSGKDVLGSNCRRRFDSIQSRHLGSHQRLLARLLVAGLLLRRRLG